MCYYIEVEYLHNITMLGIFSPHIYYYFLVTKWVEHNIGLMIFSYGSIRVKCWLEIVVGVIFFQLKSFIYFMSCVGIVILCWSHMFPIEVIYILYVMCWSCYSFLKLYVESPCVLCRKSICGWMNPWILNKDVVEVWSHI